MFSFEKFLHEYQLLAGDAERILVLSRRGIQGFNCPDFLNLGHKKTVISSFVQKEKEEEIRITFVEKSQLVLIEVSDYLKSQQVELVVSLIAKVHKITGISTLSETDILRAGKLRDFLKCSGQSYQSALAFRDKIIMKKYLSEKNIRVPINTRASNLYEVIQFIEENGFPVVVKPAQGEASQDMYILTNENDVAQIANQSNYFSAHASGIDVEEFIDGEMYHIDGLIYNGKIVVCWPSKYITQCGQMKAGKWQASILLSPENVLSKRLNDYAKQVVSSLPNPGNCGFHLEIFYTPKNEIIFCEIASRIGGGLISKTWNESFNINLYHEHLSLQLGLIEKEPTYLSAPKILAGEVKYAAKGGVLEYVGNPSRDYNWVYYSDIWNKPGDTIEPATDLTGTMAIIGFKAENEETLLEYAKTLGAWFEREIKWVKDIPTPAIKLKLSEEVSSSRHTSITSSTKPVKPITWLSSAHSSQIPSHLKTKEKKKSAPSEIQYKKQNLLCIGSLALLASASFILYNIFKKGKVPHDIMATPKPRTLN